MMNSPEKSADTTKLKSMSRKSQVSILPAWVLTCLVFGAALLMWGCDSSTYSLPEGDAMASATACGCNCFPYGSRRGSVPTRTPTPTGTWIPPRPTHTPTPTRPRGGSYATLVPRQPTQPPAWPGAITCTPAPWQPTLTPLPTVRPPVFPTFPPNTPMPSGGVGTITGQALSSMYGQSGVGQPNIDPSTGEPVFIWSQSNTDHVPDAEHRVYVRKMIPSSGLLAPATSVNVRSPRPGFKTTYNDSAVAITGDGSVHAIYCERLSDGTHTALFYRRSPDGENGWSTPEMLGSPSTTWCNSLRLKAAPDDTLWASWTGSSSTDPQHGDSNVRLFRKSAGRADNRWRDVSPPRVTRGRQFEADMTFLPLDPPDEELDRSSDPLPPTPVPVPNPNYRTILAFDDGHNVYSVYNDPADGDRWHSAEELANSETMNGKLGIGDYWPQHIRLLAFWYKGRPFVYVLWDLIVTGRIGYVYSADAAAPGGLQWTEEDTFAYFPTGEGGGGPPPTPDPEQPPNGDIDPGGNTAGSAGISGTSGTSGISGISGTPGTSGTSTTQPTSGDAPPRVHHPEPFWVPERNRVFVAYMYCDAPPLSGAARPCYAAYAYSLPDAPGSAWQGSVGSVGQGFGPAPLRALPTTQYEAMQDLQSPGRLDKSGNAWLVWQERGAGKEAFFAAIRPYTLISSSNQP